MCCLCLVPVLFAVMRKNLAPSTVANSRLAAEGRILLLDFRFVPIVQFEEKKICHVVMALLAMRNENGQLPSSDATPADVFEKTSP